MSTNRRRHANVVPLAKIAALVLVGVAACAGGLGYVWCKNQLYTTGTEIKALERELGELQNRNEVALSKIAQLSSTAKLQERYNSGFIKLVPISNDHIAVMGNDVPKVKAGELRPASNDSTHE